MASPWTIITHLPYESGVRIRRIDSPMGRGGNLEKSEKLVDVNPTYPLVI